MSSLEVIVIQTIIIFTILNDVDIAAEYIFSAYNILSVSKLCSTVDMPLYVWSLRFISNYLKSIFHQIDLFYKVMK